MKILVTKEELLERCSRCAVNAEHNRCEHCMFEEMCNRAYIDFWKNNTEVVEDGEKGK